MKIEVWSDFRCPFCYIADALMKKMVAELAGKVEIEIAHRSYELYPDAPKHADNTILDSYSMKYGLTKQEAEEKISAITEYGRKVGIHNFNYGGADPVNTFDAHRLCKYGEAMGKADIYEKLMYAFFCDNVDLADRDVLISIAEEVGLDRDKTAEMLSSSRYAMEVIADEKQARDMGIRSVPCFVADGRKFVGSGSFSELKAMIVGE